MTPVLVLVHSPLVGPTTWRPVADALRELGLTTVVPSLGGIDATRPPYRDWIANRVTEQVRADGRMILVGHSGAGRLLPAIGAKLRGRIAGYVFVDAHLPTGAGRQIDDSPFLDQLRGLAVDGVLPPWPQWWGEEAMRRLVPDDALRRAVEAECPRLPLEYFEENPPAVDGWPDAPCAFIQFSEAYVIAAEDAAQTGWPVHHLRGEHLHMLVEPGAVAKQLADIAASFGRGP